MTKENSIKKKQFLSKYANFRKKKSRNVTTRELDDEISLTANMIKHHWGSLKRLDEEARKVHPKKFDDIKIENIVSPKKLAKLRSSVSKYNKFFITTAVTSCDPHMGFHRSIKTWEKKNKGKLLVLVSSDPAHNLDKKSFGRIDKRLANEDVILEDTELNSNIFLSTIKLSAKQIDPITQLNRIGQRNGSFIFASPKQRLKSVPVTSTKLPHILMTTGAITEPDYSSTHFMSNRTAYIADNDHVIGGIIVEVVDDDKFHFRQVQADKNGDFIDLGVKYTSTKTTKVNAEAMVCEWHSGETDPVAKECFKQMCKLHKPKHIVVHDIFNGASINHHAEKDIVYRSKIADKKLDLREELKVLAKDIDELSSWCTNGIVIPKSNHDEWLTQYLQQAKYAFDPSNHGLGLKLADKMVNDGESDPLKWGIEKIIGLRKNTKVRWLSRDEDFKVAGIQLGAHGDKGANGARGSLMAMESAFGDSVTGHAHAPEILRGAWQIGTLTFLKLDYNKGPSSWFHSIIVVHPNGQRQIINIIDGEWKL